MGAYFNLTNGGKSRAVIGKDTRLSSYNLEAALVAGLTSSGTDAYLMHVTTTPSVSYVTRCDGFDFGVMISASHNPFYDNGIKLFNGNGEKMQQDIINYLEDYLSGNKSALKIFGNAAQNMGDVPFSKDENLGRSVDYVAGRNRYIGHLIALSTCSYKRFKIGLDCANGSAFSIAKSVFSALGATVFSIGDCPDGLNVNKNCGSTNLLNLQKLVIEKGLDIGFAFDGDADRCICVDSDGKVVDGDGIIFVLANYLKEHGELYNNLAIVTVLSNSALISSLKNRGVNCVTCGVGDRLVAEKMQKEGASLGGEQSGHIILSKVESTGDGVVTAIKIMEAIIESKQPLKKLLQDYVPLPQVNKNIAVKDKVQVISDVGLIKTVERIKRRLEGEGRIILRPSGTENVIRITVECSDMERCEKYCDIVSDKIVQICQKGA